MPCALSETPRKMLPPPHDHRDLEAQVVDLLDLVRQVVGEVAVDPEGLRSEKGLARELEQDALVGEGLLAAGHAVLPQCSVAIRPEPAGSPQMVLLFGGGLGGDVLAEAEPREPAHDDVSLPLQVAGRP